MPWDLAKIWPAGIVKLCSKSESWYHFKEDGLNKECWTFLKLSIQLSSNLACFITEGLLACLCPLVFFFSQSVMWCCLVVVAKAAWQGSPVVVHGAGSTGRGCGKSGGKGSCCLCAVGGRSASPLHFKSAQDASQGREHRSGASGSWLLRVQRMDVPRKELNCADLYSPVVSAGGCFHRQWKNWSAHASSHMALPGMGSAGAM